MKIGCLGAGGMAKALAGKWAATHEVMLSGRDADKTRAVAEAVGASAGTAQEAAAFGDAVVLATRWEDVFTAIDAAGGPDAFAEKIVIGINNPVEAYLEAIDEHQPDILGMSALLTTPMPYMKVVIDALVERGTRADYIVLVGGAPLNEAFAENVGADAYCRDAAVAVETAKEQVARLHNIRGGS